MFTESLWKLFYLLFLLVTFLIQLFRFIEQLLFFCFDIVNVYDLYERAVQLHPHRTFCTTKIIQFLFAYRRTAPTTTIIVVIVVFLFLSKNKVFELNSKRFILWECHMQKLKCKLFLYLGVCPKKIRSINSQIVASNQMQTVVVKWCLGTRLNIYIYNIIILTHEL